MTTPSSTSTIAQARAALYGLLVADAPAATSQVPTQLAKPVQVSFGPPGHEELEVVALLGVRAVDEDWAALGARRREETYQLEVGVKVQDPAAVAGSPGALAVDARGFELVQWVRTTVANHWTLSGTVRAAGVTGELSDCVQLGDKGFLFFSLLSVTCEADIFYPDAAP